MTDRTDPTPRDTLLAHLRKYPALEASMRLIEQEVDRIEAEGRREAVRLLRDILHAQNDGEMERAMKAAREWMKTQPVVAGLNASESPLEVNDE